MRNQPTSEDVDLLIAKEMSNLSMKEREEAILDVHCVPGVKVENPEFVNFRLEELEHHLNIIKTAENAYSLAERINPQYVSSRKMRLMFLRAQSFVPEEAAKRMITFFEEKKRLFGIKKLVKDITLEDLGEDDMETLTSGYGQVSPLRDKARRPVIFFPSKLRKYKVPENVVSALLSCLTISTGSFQPMISHCILFLITALSKGTSHVLRSNVGCGIRGSTEAGCCAHLLPRRFEVC